MPAHLDWLEKCSLAKSLGYDYIEMSIDETDEKLARLEWQEEDLAEIKKACEATGMYIGSICLSGHRKYPLGDRENETYSLYMMEKALELAAALNVRIIQLAGYDVYYIQGSAATRQRFIENLARCTEMAAAKGIMLGFETMETEFMDTCTKSMEYVDMTGSPWLSVYPDSGNLTNAALKYGHNVLEDLSAAAGHICALHLKETIPGHYRDIPFFTGHVDFEKMIRHAWDLGVRRYVTEMWYQPDQDWKAEIQKASSSMQSILNETVRRA